MEFDENLKEKEIDPSLDFGFLGSNFENVALETNVPYDYLSDEIQGEIPSVIEKAIAPNIQELLKRGLSCRLFGQDFEAKKSLFLPENMCLEKYLPEMKEIYIQKFKVQLSFRELIKSFSAGLMLDSVFLEKSDELNTISKGVEPLYFIASSVVKQQTYVALSRIREMYGDSLSQRQYQLLASQSIPSFYQSLPCDIQKLQTSSDSQKVFLLLKNKYFNESSSYAKSFLLRYFKEVVDPDDIRVFQEKSYEWNLEKSYFLLERKIPLAEKVDELLIFDNVFDKLLQIKACFLHDIFTNILKRRILSGKRPSLQNIRIKDIQKEVFLYLQEEWELCL